MKCYFNILIFFSLSTFCLAQLPYQPTIIDKGLPSKFTKDIVQDHFGYIWIGTGYGLSRYDGNSFQTFQHEKDEVTSLCHSSINEMLFDSLRKCIWIATDNGVSKLNPKGFSFKNYLTHSKEDGEINSITSICQDSFQQIWCTIGNSAIAKYDDQNDRFVQINLPTFFDDSDHRFHINGILAIAPDAMEPNRIWMGTTDGLIEFDARTQSFKLHYFDDNDAEVRRYNNQIRAVLSLQNQPLLLGTWSIGLIQYDASDAVKTINIIPKDNFKRFSKEGVNPPLLLAGDGKVLVNRRQNCLFDLANQTFEACQFVENDFGKPLVFQVQMQDNAGRYWATSEYGALFFDPLNDQFNNQAFEPSDRFYYVGGELCELENRNEILFTYEHCEGVYILNLDDNSFQLIKPTESKYLSELFFKGEGIVQKSKNSNWVLERRKMYEFNSANNSLKPLQLPIDDLGFLWYKMALDRRNNLWLGSVDSGLVRYNLHDKSIKIFKDNLSTKSPGSPVSIQQLLADDQDNIWIATERGAMVYNQNSNSITPLAVGAIREMNVKDIEQGADGHIWLVIENYGLGMVNRDVPIDQNEIDVEIVQNLKRRDITQIAFDTSNNIWMITHAGIQRFNLSDQTCHLFQQKDGLIMYDPNFNRNPSVLTDLVSLSNNQLAFAPRAGITMFSPDQLITNQEVPKPYIKAIYWGDSTILKNVESAPEKLQWRFKKRAFQIIPSALGFSQSEANHFYFRLLPTINDWQKTSPENIRFSLLSPADYTFELKVANSQGLFSEIYSLPFEILNPWWQTFWFLGSLFLILGGIIWYIQHQKRQRKLSLLKKEQEYKVLLAGLESKALRNQMNPHFLFNIFNTIQELILTGNTMKAYSYTSKFSKLLRMIMEFSQKDDISIEQETHFLTLFLELESLRFDDAFTFNIEIESGLDFYHIPVFMVQPLVENAIRHGLLPKDGEKSIHIYFAEQNGEVITTVVDNGVGLYHPMLNENDDRDHAIKLIRKRLQSLAGGDLQISNRNGNEGVIAILKTPLKR